mmetsp:Transcript_22049/g.39529  ORF Transcript_22049/g.39529 Transcript_22049/m.39529 type:complete len:87 (+) Transcript_22049:583-843(+)
MRRIPPSSVLLATVQDMVLDTVPLEAMEDREVWPMVATEERATHQELVDMVMDKDMLEACPWADERVGGFAAEVCLTNRFISDCVN